MEELMSYVEPVSLIALVGICLGKMKMLHGRLSNKVSKETFQTSHESVGQRIDDFQKHVDSRFDDIKSLIESK